MPRPCASRAAQLGEVKHLELQSREALSKRRAADTRLKELQRELEETTTALERERREARSSAASQKGAAATELRRHLKEQRSSYEAQMAEVVAECERRIAFIEQRMREDARALAAQYAQAIASANERAAANGGFGLVHAGRAPTQPEGPHLHTMDRSIAWSKEEAAKEEAGLKPWDPWHERYGAAEFRLIRQPPSKMAAAVAATQRVASVASVAAAFTGATRAHEDGRTAGAPAAAEADAFWQGAAMPGGVLPRAPGDGLPADTLAQPHAGAIEASLLASLGYASAEPGAEGIDRTASRASVLSAGGSLLGTVVPKPGGSLLGTEVPKPSTEVRAGATANDGGSSPAVTRTNARAPPPPASPPPAAPPLSRGGLLAQSVVASSSSLLRAASATMPSNQ